MLDFIIAANRPSMQLHDYSVLERLVKERERLGTRLVLRSHHRVRFLDLLRIPTHLLDERSRATLSDNCIERIHPAGGICPIRLSILRMMRLGMCDEHDEVHDARYKDVRMLPNALAKLQSKELQSSHNNSIAMLCSFSVR